MMDRVNLFYILLAVAFAFVVIRKTIRQKMMEQDSLLWLFLAVLMLVLGFFPRLLGQLATLFGIEYPPALLFLAATLVLIYIALQQAIHVSQLQEKVRELAQRLAILETDQSGDKRDKP